MSEEAKPGRTTSGFSMEVLSSAVQTLAIVLAGAWGVYTFIYEAKIAPGLAPPSVSVTSTLERVGQKGNLVAIRSTVTRTNVGQAEVRVLALTYNVIGVRVRFREAGEAGAFPQALPGSSAIAQARYYDEAEGGEVLLRHGVLFEGATELPSEPSALNPGEAVSRDLIFYADPDRFDTIRFQVELAYAKRSEPPVPLTFEVAPNGRLAAVPGPPCRDEPSRCRPLVVTDFGTEFSLWRP
ncbi:hypothetical protein [Sabulicella glaciei]|uniref:Uncharacterized protein n=1 Tax=Sabulicella glaciei TaxID=2984948 RepID=A0ABT3NYU7_9PROT|nr:hypothetical protein [Roseococcus sp. MDT2-1-1]MCW8087337.1 hypothetical protein [Roseococcus sp. MDT2-1-1]